MWVKFHDELTEGEKRGIPRAARFVYMELSLKARKRKGWLPLASGMSDAEAVHDALGGNRAEVVSAIKILAHGHEPMIRFEDTSGGRRLVVVSWEKWNKIDSSAARVQRYRGKSNEDVTRYSGVSNAPVTLLDQIRSDPDQNAAALDPPAKIPTRDPDPLPVEPEPAAAAAAAPGSAEEAEAAIRSELRRHDAFARLDCYELAKALTARHMTRFVAGGTTLAWTLAAIGECAADCAGVGLSAEATAKKLRAYVDRARAPRKELPSPTETEPLAQRIPEGVPNLGPVRPMAEVAADAARALAQFDEALRQPAQGPGGRPIRRPGYADRSEPSKAPPSPQSAPAIAPVH